MSTYTINRRAKETARLLERAAHFSRMAKGCPPSNRRRLYRRKDAALAQALGWGRDEEFKIDSLFRGHRLALGVTHVPSGRQFHVFPYQMSFAAQVRLHRLSRRDGIDYPFLGIADEIRCGNGHLADSLEAMCHE